jgi:hypothetical protein
LDEDKWRAFTFDFLRERISRTDDVTPKEVVDSLLWSWHLDKERPSKDEVLRHCLEHFRCRTQSAVTNSLANVGVHSHRKEPL